MNKVQLPGDLFNAGFLHSSQRTNHDFPLLHSAKITAVANWIESNLTKTEEINPEWNSYSLKCLYKDATGQDLTNGEFIAAMITAGFACTRSQLNGLFNVDGSSVQRLEEKAYITLSVKVVKGGAFLPSVNKFNRLSSASKQSIIDSLTKKQAIGKPFTYAYLNADNITIRFMQDERGKIIEAEAKENNIEKHIPMVTTQVN